MRVFSLLMILLLVGGCSSDPVEPDPDPIDPEVWFDGSYDDSGLVLQRTEVFGKGGVVVTLDLVATELEYDPREQRLSAVVQVRNTSRTDLYAPADITLSNFTPDSIRPLNAISVGEDARRWRYDYSDALGDDDILSAGEESSGVLWILQLPGPGSFSFAAVARFAAQADFGVLGGHLFLDANRDGERDPSEGPGIGSVEVTYPDGRKVVVRAAESGLWSVRSDTGGIHTARWISPPTAAGILPICLTTPNPLQILMTPGPDGVPNSFRDADFGIDPEPCVLWRPMPILVSDVPVDTLESDPWTLIRLHQTGPDVPGPERLDITVGFGGCSAGHPLTFAFERPDDTAVPKTTMTATIVHDDLGELCEAYFHTTRSVELSELRRMWLDLTGQEGPRVLEMHTPQGIEVFELR